MQRSRRLLSTVGIALALGAGGVSDGLAGDPQGKPTLPSDNKPLPVPSFALPSDGIPGTSIPYPYRTDPTGQLVDNIPTAAEPSLPAKTTNSQFLTYAPGTIRIDSTMSACQYYKALAPVTGVTGCDTNGALQGANIVTFEKWKHDVQIDKYGPEGQTDVGHFINLVDLNLTRNHHLISHGPNQLAGYVCNHSGPAKTAADPSGLFPTEDEIDGLIAGIKSKSSLIACVAMEFSQRAAPAGKKPFTMFLIFGPNGALLSTVDLDGRGPKGVPNICTACHGGTFDYNTTSDGGATQHFDETQTKLYYNPYLTTGLDDASNVRPVGDLGAHFLPFDKGNFAFSSKLSEARREEAIFKLNLDVYTTEHSLVAIDKTTGQYAANTLGSASIAQLIEGWYNFNLSPTNLSPHFNLNYIATQSAWDYDAIYSDAYLNVVAHSCRTCHTALDGASGSYAFEVNPYGINDGQYYVCGTPGVPNSHVMPNSKVTFDRFWLTQATPSQPALPSGTPDQPSILAKLFANPLTAGQLPPPTVSAQPCALQ